MENLNTYILTITFSISSHISLHFLALKNQIQLNTSLRDSHYIEFGIYYLHSCFCIIITGEYVLNDTHYLAYL